MRRARPRVRKTPTLLSTHAGPIGRRRNPTKGNWKPEPSSHLCFARIRGRSSGHSVMGRCGLLVCDSHCHVHSVTVRNQSTVTRRDRNHSPTAFTNGLYQPTNEKERCQGTGSEPKRTRRTRHIYKHQIGSHNRKSCTLPESSTLA
jgi:hypothetical protein